MRLPVSFIVIAHRDSQTLSKALSAVETSATSSDQLILVLNNPDAATLKIAQNHSQWLKVHESRPGPAWARNAGVTKAEHDLLCFLDADIAISPEWIENMADHFRNPWIVAGQSRIVMEDKTSLHAELKRYSYLKFCSTFYASGREMPVRLTMDTAALMVRKVWFQRVNGFDTTFLRMEDTDFTWRLLNLGADLFYDDRVTATEIFDPQANVFEFFIKRFKSMQLAPLILRKHHLDYFYPPLIPPLKSRHLKRIWYWDLLLKLTELIGVALSPHTLYLSPNHFSAPVGQAKKMYLQNNSNPGLRSFWVGAREKIYDLNAWCLFRK